MKLKVEETPLCNDLKEKPEAVFKMMKINVISIEYLGLRKCTVNYSNTRQIQHINVPCL